MIHGLGTFTLQIWRERNFFVNRPKRSGLVCFALSDYANDITKKRQDIAMQNTMKEPSPEQGQTFLKMDDVDEKLERIQDEMEKYWCEKY
jgi:hypothetical protein